MTVLLAASSVFGSFWNVYAVGKLSQATQLLPFLVFLSITLSWPLFLTNVTASTYKLMYIFNGTVFVHTVSSIILAHLTKSPYPAITLLHFVQVGVFVATSFVLKNYSADMVLSCGLVAAVLWHSVLVKKVIEEICVHLNISCLTIPKRQSINSSEERVS